MLFLNQDKNLMALLTILYKERNKWIQMADLAAVIGVTRKTVRSYILSIEEKFREHARFYYNGSMVYAQFHPNFGLLSMKKLLIVNHFSIEFSSILFLNRKQKKHNLPSSLDSVKPRFIDMCKTLMNSSTALTI